MTSTFKLLGIKGEENYESLKRIIQKVNKRLLMVFELKEINKVDEILNYQINVIPAMIISNEIIFEFSQHLLDEDEFYSIVSQSLTNKTLALN